MSPVSGGTVTGIQVAELDARLQGYAVSSDQAGFAAASRSRFPNLEVAWKPEAVVSCACVSDVQAATRFAGEHGLGIAVRGGGVGWIGAGPGTLLIDLAGLDRVTVEPRLGVVSAQCGALWRDVGRELGRFGLAAAAPQFPSLGIAGYALGGGHGWLSGKLGWGSDTLLAAEIVTADGRLVRADSGHQSDLFWALRGAGHNFGVAVSLEFATIELDSATFGAVWFDPAQTGAALEAYREWIIDSPDELTTIVSVAHPPADLGRPPEHHGRACCHVLVCHCGDAGQADRDLAPIQSHDHVIASTVQRVPWSTIATAGDPFAANVHRRSRMHYIDGLSDDVIATTAEYADTMSELSFMSTHHYGGAMRRAGEHATAMSHRHEAWNYMVTSSWNPGDDGEPLQRWQDGYLNSIAEHSTGAYYVNYLFDEPERVRAAYNPTTWDRLRHLKRLWDPDNLFAANHNVPPADG